MINCEWIRKQKKERPSLGSSPGPKCKPNVRLRVRCANTEQPLLFCAVRCLAPAERDEIRESSYIKYRAILGGISSRGWAAADCEHLHRVGRCPSRGNCLKRTGCLSRPCMTSCRSCTVF